MAGAGLMTYQAKEVLNKVLNTSNDSLQVDIVDATGISITTTSDSVYVDDADWTDGSSKHTLVGGLYQSSPQSITDGDVGPFQVDADGALHIADGGNSITIDGTVTADLGSTDNAVLDAIAASLALLDNSIASGNELQVDVVGSLPAGSAAIGKLAANTGVDIGDVDVTSIVPGTGATNLGKAEDATHSSGDTGVMGLAVRNDSLAALGGADGDYAPLQVDASGALYVNVGAESIDLDIEGPAAENAAASGNPVLTGGRYDSSARTLGDGDVGAIALDADGAVQISDGGNAITVDGTVTADLSSTDNAVLDAMVVDLAAMEVLLTTIDSDTDAIKTAVQILDDWDDSDYANVNMNITGSDVAAGNPVPTTHSVTGIAHGVKTVTTAGSHVALDTSTACKKVDIQAQTDNTNVIAVGASGVDATVATGTGILLNAGDVYSLEIDNLNDVYIDSLVDGEGVRFTYFT
jgi:hypothetical protein